MTRKSIAVMVLMLGTGLEPSSNNTMIIQTLILQSCRRDAFSLGVFQLDGSVEGFLCL